MTLRIVADENIPYVHELFSAFGEVITVAGRSMSNEVLSEANILLVRSVTEVNEQLLDNSAIEFVGTCTIGVDHLDTEYLDKHGIQYASSPGCNANAVVQYVLGVLAHLNGFDPAELEKKVMIVGGGNVGGRVYDALSAIGFDCRIVDPFLDASCGRKLEKFSYFSSADIICLHAPLTVNGDHPTRHMFAEDELLQLKSGALLINAGRGGVVDNRALANVLARRTDIRVVLDVWENEPDISVDLFKCVEIGTPHIAGYSFEGRLQGALMIFDSLAKYLPLDTAVINTIRETVCANAMGSSTLKSAQPTLEPLLAAVIDSYDVREDHAELNSVIKRLPDAFDLMRKHYRQRREFSHYCYSGLPESSRALFLKLGFDVEA